MSCQFHAVSYYSPANLLYDPPSSPVYKRGKERSEAWTGYRSGDQFYEAICLLWGWRARPPSDCHSWRPVLVKYPLPVRAARPSALVSGFSRGEQPRLGKNGAGFGCFSRGPSSNQPRPTPRIRVSEFFRWGTSVQPNIFRTSGHLSKFSPNLLDLSHSFLPSSSQKSPPFVEINEIFTWIFHIIWYNSPRIARQTSDENLGSKRRIIDNQSRMEEKKGGRCEKTRGTRRIIPKDIRRRRSRRRRRRHVFAPAVKTRRAAEY